VTVVVEVENLEAKAEIVTDVEEGLGRRGIGKKANGIARKIEKRKGREKRRDCRQLRKII
jgi:hypothetical protein